MGGSASGIGSAFPYNWTKTDFTKTDSRSAAKPLRSEFNKQHSYNSIINLQLFVFLFSCHHNF